MLEPGIQMFGVQNPRLYEIRNPQSFKFEIQLRIDHLTVHWKTKDEKRGNGVERWNVRRRRTEEIDREETEGTTKRSFRWGDENSRKVSIMIGCVNPSLDITSSTAVVSL